MARHALAQFLAGGRKATGMSQIQAGAAIGIGGGQISKWERAQSLPEARRLAKIAAVLNVDKTTLDDLYLAASEEDRLDARRELGVARQDLDDVLHDVRRFVDTYQEFHAEYQRIGVQVNQLVDEVAEIKQAFLCLRRELLKGGERL